MAGSMWDMRETKEHRNAYAYDLGEICAGSSDLGSKCGLDHVSCWDLPERTQETRKPNNDAEDRNSLSLSLLLVIHLVIQD